MMHGASPGPGHALVVIAPGFQGGRGGATLRPDGCRLPILRLSGEGAVAVGWMLDHPDEVAAMEAELVPTDVGRFVPLPVAGDVG